MGRKVYFSGINDLAACYAGIKVEPIRIILYTVSSLLATIGAILTSSSFTATKADVGTGIE